MIKVERDILRRASEFADAAEAVGWLIEKGVLDHKRCRVLLIKEHYAKLLGAGASKMDALTATAEEFSVAEATVSEAIYRYRDI